MTPVGRLDLGVSLYITDMNSFFNSIRSHSGSQANGFEELCCQLAHAESVPPGAKFRRKGTPDGGVECFWILAGGEEWAWQAKYFDSLDDSQIRQLDDSVKTALAKHPRLTRYTICMPLDLADPRKTGENWAQDRWNTAVERWTQWAEEAKRTIAFERWGAFEITDRLMKTQNAGRRWYWFRDEELSNEWFADHVRVQIRFVGPRYSPELKVDLPIARVFRALGNAPEVRIKLRKVGLDLRDLVAYRSTRMRTDLLPTDVQSLNQTLTEALKKLLDHLGRFTEDVAQIPSAEATLDLQEEADRACRLLKERLSRDPMPKPKPQRTKESVEDPSQTASQQVSRIQHLLRDLAVVRYEFDADVISRPALLVAGDAGSGKTHLLCDVASQRVSDGLPTILILGEQLGPTEPWSQIIHRLGLSCTRDEFLGALDSAAEAAGQRALILIDALNERTEGRWKNELPAILEVLAQHPWIGVAVTCRTTYERSLIRNDLVPGRLTRIEHQGFAGKLFEATSAFFKHYGIESPRTPPLNPEFQNPLFLKLFCEGLKRTGKKRPSRGYHGLSWAFTTVIDAVNEKLSQPEELDYVADERVVQRGLTSLAATMAQEGRSHLPFDQARAILDGILKREGHSQSLLGRLISEGIITQDIYYDGSDAGDVLVLRFTYERFADYQLASHYLDQYFDPDNPEASFSETTPLGQLVSDSDQRWRFSGLLAALCSLVPERSTSEMIDLVRPEDRSHLRDAFLESLPWRDGTLVRPGALDFIEELLGIDDPERFSEALNSYYQTDQVIDGALSACAEPNHPLNAEWIHRWLSALQMPLRDAIWSTYLHRQHGRGGAVERILDWSWPDEIEQKNIHSDVDDESIRLLTITLGWFLSTPNRFIRDRATKALVALLHRRPHLLMGFLSTFENVDDPYIRERALAVVYGSLIRSGKLEHVRVIAHHVFVTTFAGGFPPAHILVRDYARNIIEYALHLGWDGGNDVERIRPPYASTLSWPPPVPTEEEFRQLCDQEGYFGFSLSLGHMGDFYRYVLQCDSNSGIHEYRSVVPAIPESVDEEVPSIDLAEALREAMERLGKNFRVAKPDDQSSEDIEEIEESEDNEEDDDERQWLESRNASSRDDQPEDDCEVDPTLAPRWILQRVMELGWTPGLFRYFDSSISQNDNREADKAERVGKKYQWIALHEFYAHVLDHHPFRVETYSKRSSRYSGPWELSCRDIDSSLLAKGRSEDEQPSSAMTWWSPIPSPFASAIPSDDHDWLQSLEHLPDPERFLVIRSPKDHRHWFCLSNSGRWSSVLDQENEGDTTKRRASFFCDSYLLRKSDLKPLTEWLATCEGNQASSTCRVPEGLWLGEYPWAPSFEELREQATVDWPEFAKQSDNLFHPGLSGWPIPLVVTTMSYTGSFSGFDCSGSKGFAGEIPSLWLGQLLGIEWSGRFLRFEEPSGRVIAFDPSVEEQGPSALLIGREDLQRFLTENQLSLFWYVYAEKLVMTERSHNFLGRLRYVRTYYLEDSCKVIANPPSIERQGPDPSR